MDYILVIDDDADVRDFLSALLETKGYVVKTARSGENIFSVFEEKCPALVMMDINMPWVQGDKICRVIKKTYPDVKVIIMSGIDQDELKQRADDAGADYIIPKPFDVEDLFFAVSQNFQNSPVND